VGNKEAYEICAGLYGSCSCAAASRPPCDAIQSLADDGMDADDERHRIEAECADAGEDDF
jgi:hypothetical protein